VNAIGRSRKKPQRAESILKRVQVACDAGDRMVKPDVILFNALINAYGWSTERGKSAKCYEIFNVMIDLHASKTNFDAKPDIVTCNSVLNACAFEKTRSETEHEEIMNIVVETLETFQSSAPKYGYPDHATYAQVLLAISNHMPMNEKREKLAEATFWQVSCVFV
jgi:NAD-dependent SIR2 family protein deacetylase